MDGRKNGWMDGWIDGWKDGRKNGWMRLIASVVGSNGDGWMDG